MAKPQLLSGARAVIKREDGTVLGVATDVTVNVRSAIRRAYVLGSLNPVDNTPISYDVDGTIGSFVPVNALDDAEASIFKSAIAYGLNKPINEILTSEDVNIIVYDKARPGKPEREVMSIRNARLTTDTINVPVDGEATARWAFIGIYDAGLDGTENSPPDLGYNV